MKILNLNLHNYHEWDKRKPKILKFIKEQNPDIIVLQEVRDDVRFNKKGYNQAKQLNKILKYPYLFFKGLDNHKDRPEKYPLPCFEGIAILSKHEFLKKEVMKLKKHHKDKYSCENIYVRIKADKVFDLLAVHFSPNDKFSLLNLKETLRWVKEKKTLPILIGDFNIWHTSWLKELTKKDFDNSYNYKRYISYPLKNWTLDYILIPKNSKFTSLKTYGKGLSDHKALVAEVEIK